MFILVGIFVAVWLGNKRWVARGGLDGQVADIAMWAVPFGIVGGRIYHVLTDWELYFSEGGKGLLGALRIWEGGLGIWGALALGGVGAWIGAKRLGVPFAPFADSIAPGVAFAQAIGRLGNWFNQELFGRPTTLPWGLEISVENRPTEFTQFETFHPTFLYEALACVAIGFFVIWADKRYVMGHGRVFALYVALYCAARGLIETMRIDDARHILGIRFNVFTALFIGAMALLYLVRSSEKNPGRELMHEGKLVIQGKESQALDASKVDAPSTDAEHSVSSSNSSPEIQEPKQRGRRAKPKQ
jgi:prolipoprotein diacylglyceryl transferase